MWRRGLLVVAIALSTATLVHCGSFGAADEPVGDAGPANEGGPGPADAQGAADGDATNGDARSPPTIFDGCALALYEDFEHPAVIENGRWDDDRVQASGGGTLLLDTADAFKGMTSMRVNVSAGTPAAYLQRSLGTRARVRYAFALRPGPNVARTIALNSIELNGGDVQFAVFFAITNGMLEVREQQASGGTAVTSIGYGLGAIRTGWHKYAIALTLSPAMKPRVEVTIDTDKLLITELAYPLLPGDVKVRSGVSFAQNGVASDVWLDDVAICSEP